jgi:hypothetical protein
MIEVILILVPVSRMTSPFLFMRGGDISKASKEENIWLKILKSKTEQTEQT